MQIILDNRNLNILNIYVIVRQADVEMSLLMTKTKFKPDHFFIIAHASGHHASVAE